MAKAMRGSAHDEADPQRIRSALDGLTFPRTKGEILDYVRGGPGHHGGREGEHAQVLAVLERIPDRRYEDIADVQLGVGRAED